MKNETVYTFHSDPCHGWVEVTLADLNQVGLSLRDISGFSYRKGNRLFLEEDCDYGRFYEAHKATYGHAPLTRDVYTDDDFPEANRLRGIHS